MQEKTGHGVKGDGRRGLKRDLSEKCKGDEAKEIIKRVGIGCCCFCMKGRGGCSIVGESGVVKQKKKSPTLYFLWSAIRDISA